MKTAARTMAAVCAAAGLVSCGTKAEECLALPCALPLAIEVRITAVGGGPLTGAALQVTGVVTASIPCDAGPTGNMCPVPGVAGAYDLEAKASGFQTVRRSVTVKGTTPECGCPTVETARLDLALTPIVP